VGAVSFVRWFMTRRVAGFDPCLRRVAPFWRSSLGRMQRMMEDDVSPTPEEIAERAAEIRAEWSAEEHYKRGRPEWQRVGWVLPGSREQPETGSKPLATGRRRAYHSGSVHLLTSACTLTRSEAMKKTAKTTDAKPSAKATGTAT